MEAVTHELKVHDELPPRRTLLNSQLAKIASHPEWYGKPVQIGSYRKVSAANGAKHLLQSRWGKIPTEQGWEFATRHIVEEGEERTGLFAIFTPDAVVPHNKSGQVPVVESKSKVLSLPSNGGMIEPRVLDESPKDETPPAVEEVSTPEEESVAESMMNALTAPDVPASEKKAILDRLDALLASSARTS